jgi:hypothetical protein
MSFHRVSSTPPPAPIDMREVDAEFVIDAIELGENGGGPHPERDGPAEAEQLVEVSGRHGLEFAKGEAFDFHADRLGEVTMRYHRE